MSCFNCFVSMASIYKWLEFTILRWIFATIAGCWNRPGCTWWCLCCEKLLCILYMIILFIVAIVIWLIVEIVVAVFCILVALWCLLCSLVCWIGCLGNKQCFDTCVAESSCDTATIELDWDPPAPPVA